MKGISYWFWVMAGIIAGLVIFSVAYQQLSQINIATTEQRSSEQFLETKDIINNLCWSSTGSKRQYQLNLAEVVDGIYASDDKYKEYQKDDLVAKILGDTSSNGQFLCLSMKDKRLRCEQLECKVLAMPFMGSVPENSSLSSLVNNLLGRARIFDYLLKFERTDEGVSITRIGYQPNTPSTTSTTIQPGPTTTIPGPTTTTTTIPTTTTNPPGCSDGTPIARCSSINPGMFCDENGRLVDRCSLCMAYCPMGWICMPSGKCMPTCNTDQTGKSSRVPCVCNGYECNSAYCCATSCQGVPC